MISSSRGSGMLTAARPSSATASASLPGSRPASRSPRRWLQVIPAACMNVASPSSSAHSASQVARSRLVSSRGSPLPPSSARISGVVTFRRAGSRPAGDQAGPGELRGGQQELVVAGQHRHGPRPPAAHLHDDAAGPAGDVAAADGPQVGADQPGACSQADQPGGAHPPRGRGLGVREREIAVDLRRGYRAPWPARGAVACPPGELRDHLPGQEPQVGPQRPPRHARQPGRVRGEPLDHRRVQQHLRDRLQAQPDRPVREPARRPQQVLRPLPPARRRLAHHGPGERRGLRRHRRRPPAARYSRLSRSRHLPPPDMSTVKYCGHVG